MSLSRLTRVLRQSLAVGALTLTVIASASSTQAAEWLVICAGQSNMDGRGPVRELPPEYKTMPANVVIYRLSPGTAASPKPLHMLVDEKQTQFGPEVAMVHALAKARPQDRFIISKFAVGGTSLWQWVPDYEAPGIQYKKATDPANGRLYETLKIGTQAVVQLHPTAKPLAFCWLQGESDSGPKASVYLANLRRLVTNVRNDFKAPHARFIAADPAAAAPEVDAAFKSFVAADPAAAMISCRALPHKDAMHYNAPSVVIIGTSFAGEVLKGITP